MALVILRGSLRHVQIKLKNVVKFVSWVKIAQAFSDTRILRSWTLHADSRLRSLGFFFMGLDFRRMINDPVIVLFVPNCHLFILFILLRRNKMINDVLFEFQLVGQLVNGVEHVISLTVKVLLTTI
jgi:hypothetical protein